VEKQTGPISDSDLHDIYISREKAIWAI